MKNYFQVNIKSKILMAMIFGVAASFTGNSTNQFQSFFNSSFLGDEKKLFDPVVIPNITAISEQLFISTPRANSAQKIKNSNFNNNKTHDYFIKKILYPEETVSQESKVEAKYTEDNPKTSDNSLKFSSRYSSRAESSEENVKNVDESEEKKDEEKDDEKKSDNKSGEVFDSEENEKSDTGSDVISKSDKHKELDKYENIPYPAHSYYESRKEEKSGSRRYSDANEPREAEESEVLTTTNEPYPELRRPTSYRNSQYSDEEFENYETPSVTADERDNSNEEEEEKEDKRSVDDYHDSGSKNYHSVQTPLKEIKFRGSQPSKDDFESDKTGARLASIGRHPIAHNWPYSKSKLKEDLELNEILDSEEKDNSEEWQPHRVKVSSQLLDLEKAAEKDEASLENGLNNGYNEIRGRNGKTESINELSSVEEKDLESPLLQSLKNYESDKDKRPKIHPTTTYIPKPKPKPILTLNEHPWSTIPSKSDLENSTPFQKLFNDHPTIKAVFNFTTEISPNIHAHQYSGPAIFNQHVEPRKPTEKTYLKNYNQPKKPVQSNYLKDLENRELVDRQNLRSHKNLKAILSGGHKKITPSSFNHQQENEELYNQILANIQSVFGQRTQSLKSSSGRKETLQELNFDENNTFTWSLPSRNGSRVIQETPKISAFKSSESNLNPGSKFIKSVFPSDIITP